MNRTKRNFFDWAAYIFAWVLFVLFTPSMLFLSNVDEFEVSYSDTVGIIVCVTLLWVLVIAGVELILNKLGKTSDWLLNIVFSISLSGYIQINFLNGNLPELNGTTIKWNYLSWQSFVSSFVWISILLIPILLYKRHKRIIDKIRNYVSGFLSAVMLLTLVVLIISTKDTSINNKVITKEDEFQLAKDENVIVFVVDTLDTEFVEKYILDDEEYGNLFDDFVYYDNVVSGGAPTHLGIPALLTGEIYDNPESMSLDDYYRNAWSKSNLFNDLTRAGVKIRLYTKMDLLSYADVSQVDNVSEGDYEIGNKPGFAECLYKLTAFCVSPYLGKQCFTMYSGDFSKTIGISGGGLIYRLDDPQFYSDLCESGVSTGEYEKGFTLYHLYGAHPPYTMDANAKRVKENTKDLEGQVHGCCKILNEYIEMLKKSGIYDNSTIIVMGDHGGVDVYQNPAVLVKYKSGIECEEKIDSRPAMFSNVYATIANTLLGDTGEYGLDLMDDLSFYDEVGRFHIAKDVLYVQSGRSEKLSGNPYDVYIIKGDAKEPKSVMEPSNTVALDESLPANKVRFCAIDGFSGSELNYVWTDGNEAELEFVIEEKYTNLRLDMSYSTFLSEQQVELYVNDELISKFIANGEEEKSIVIPGDIVKNGIINMRFVLPDATAPCDVNKTSKDKRKLALAISKMKFSNTDDEFVLIQQIDGGIQYDEEVFFSSDNDMGKDILIKGFSLPEQDGVWTDGKEAEMKFYIKNENRNIKLYINHYAFNGEQSVLVYVNDTLIEQYVAKSMENRCIEIPRSVVDGNIVNLKFELPDAVSPKEIGEGEDTRLLALFIKSLRIE